MLAIQHRGRRSRRSRRRGPRIRSLDCPSRRKPPGDARRLRDDGGPHGRRSDLAFVEDGGSVVVDFKTDVEMGVSGLERYRRQVGLYAAAVGLATGAPVEGILLRV